MVNFKSAIASICVVGVVLAVGVLIRQQRRVSPQPPIVPVHLENRGPKSSELPGDPRSVEDLLELLRVACREKNTAQINELIHALISKRKPAIQPCLTAFCTDVYMVPGELTLQFAVVDFMNAVGEVLQDSVQPSEVAQLVQGYLIIYQQEQDRRPAKSRGLDATRMVAGALTKLIEVRVTDLVRDAIADEAIRVFKDARTTKVRLAVIELMRRLRGARSTAFLRELVKTSTEQELANAAALALGSLGDTAAVPDLVVKVRQMLRSEDIRAFTDIIKGLLELAPLRDVLPLLCEAAEQERFPGASALIGMALGMMARTGKLTDADTDAIYAALVTESSAPRLNMLLASLEMTAASDHRSVIFSQYVLDRTQNELVAQSAIENISRGGIELELMRAMQRASEVWGEKAVSITAESLARFAFRHPEGTYAQDRLTRYAAEGSAEIRLLAISAMNARQYGSETPQLFRPFLEQLLRKEKDEAIRSRVDELLKSMDSDE